ncbi:MAG: threonine ammonia-lyase [Bacteroidetes bacterium]|nr:MAG: threonine ammonia-lyase [Bacteroidota bacterium]
MPDVPPSLRPVFEDLVAARETVRAVARHTPLIRSKTFSEMAGCDVFLKLENLQRTGSFKLRGAYHRISRLAPGEKARGVVCASAGNHAQGVAFSAAAHGIASTVFMPVFAPPAKIQATRAYGAEVRLVGRIYDEAYEAARAFCEEHGKTYIPAFDDEAIIAGQGTLGLELYDDLPDVDVVLCPVGGGGLIGGVAVALKHLRPSVRIVGVEAEGAPALKRSLEAGHLVPATSLATIADGIAVKTPGRLTFALARAYVDEVVTVPDSDTAYALYLLLQRAKLLVEPAGAVGLAALLAGTVAYPGRRVAVILSGGNVDLGLLTQIIERGLLHTGLRARIAVDMPDKPGSLQLLLDILAGLQANIESVEHDRFTTAVPIGHVRITITFRTPGREHIDAIRQALAERHLTCQVLT